MGQVNVRVDHESTNISAYVLEYERENDLCSGVGTFSVVVDRDAPYTFSPGDELVLYENSDKRGTYYISTLEENANGNYTLAGQDTTKWMKGYFLDNTYKTNGGTTRYWIGWVLDLVGISYSFTTSENGPELNPNTELGLESAFDILMRLCQQAGWYFYVDPNEVCKIGSLDNSWGSSNFSIKTDDGNVVTELLDGNDSMLRNRAIIYGDLVNVQMDVNTAWDRNANDRRAVVYSNNFINSTSVAADIGKKLLDEFSKTVSIKAYSIAGYVDATVGDIAYCETNIFNGSGRVTNIKSRTTPSKGFVTEIILDQRCPRLFSYWRYDEGSEYVYVGTNGSGVWRKTISGTTWENFSVGITNLNIVDLIIKNGVLVCTTNNDEAYKRSVEDSSWTNITPVGFTILNDEGTPEDVYTTNFVCRGCGIDENTGIITIGYYDTSTETSWVMSTTSTDISLYTWTRVIENSTNEIELIDTDNNNKETILTARIESGGTSETETVWQSVNGEAVNECGQLYYGQIDENLVSLGSAETTIDLDYEAAIYSILNCYIVDNKIFSATPTTLKILDLDDYTLDNLTFGSTVDAVTHIYVASGDADVVHLIRDNDYHYTYTISTDTLNAIGTVHADYNSIVGEGVVKDGYYYTLTNDDLSYESWKFYKYDFGAESSSYVAWDLDDYTTDNPITNGIWGMDAYGCVTATSTGVTATVMLSVWNYDSPTVSYLESWAGFMTWTNGSTSSKSYKLLDSFLITYSLATKSMRTRARFLSKTKNGSTYVFLENHWYLDSTYYYSRGFTIEVPSYNVTKEIDYTARTTDYYNAYFELQTQPTLMGASIWLQSYTVPIVGRNKALFTTCSQSAGAYINEYIVDVSSDNTYDASSYFPTYMAGKYRGFGITLDEYDNTLLVTDSNTFKSLNYITGATVKTYTGLAGYVDAADTAVIIPGNLLVHYGDHTSTVYVYSFEGVEFPQGDGDSIIALTNGFVATSGDTFGRIGVFTVSGLVTSSGTLGSVFLECSQSIPSLFYGGITFSGSVPSGIASFSMTNTSGSLVNYPKLNLGRVLNMRSLHLLNSSTWTIDHTTFALVRGGLYNRVVDDESTAWQVYEIPTVGNYMHRMETSNFGTPYLFYSTSGAPSKFYQKQETDTSFTEKSTSLPSNNITVIRLDDRI